MLMAIIILAVTANNISQWHDLGCGTPSKLDYNLAAVCGMYSFLRGSADKSQAVISILALIYLLLSTGVKRVNAIPWHPFGQLGLDAFLLILWIAAAATSTVTCDDACNACKNIGAEFDGGCGYCTFEHTCADKFKAVMLS